MTLEVGIAKVAELLQVADREPLYRVADVMEIMTDAEENEDAFCRLADAAELAIGVEKSCQLLYQTLAKRVRSGRVQALFQDLAAQEAEHHASFVGLIRPTQGAAAVTDGAWDEHEADLRATFHSAVYGWPDGTPEGLLKALSAALFRGRAFGWPSSSLALASKVKSEKQALNLAIEFEKDTLLFLYNLSDIVADSDQELLDRVIDEERSHLGRLDAML